MGRCGVLTARGCGRGSACVRSVLTPFLLSAVPKRSQPPWAMDSDQLNKLIDSFARYDYHKYKNVPDRYMETLQLTAPTKFTDAQYAAAVEAHLNDVPMRQVHCGYTRAGYDLPTEKYEREPETGFWICHLHDGNNVYKGVSRDKKTATHIAATYLLDNAINTGRNEFFFLPKDKDAALRHMEAKREALIKVVEESKNPNSFQFINEYAQFNRVSITAKESDAPPPYTSTIEFDGEIYVTEPAPTKKEARRNTAKLVYDKLIESGKYYEFKQAQAVAQAEKKVKEAKYRVAKTTSVSTNECDAKIDGSTNAGKNDSSNESKNPVSSEPSGAKTAEAISS